MASEEKIKHENPWGVSNIEEFLYYCCPECDTKQKTKSDFITHAIDAHGQLFIEDAAQNHEQAKIVPLYLVTKTELEDEEMQMSHTIDPPDFSNDEDLEEQNIECLEQKTYNSTNQEQVSNNEFTEAVMNSEPILKKESIVEPPKAKMKKVGRYWRCEECNLKYKSKNSLKNHLAKEHYEGQCQHCQIETTDLKSHIREEHPEKLIRRDKCDVCNEKHYKIHLNERQEDGMFHCGQCEYTSKTHDALRSHRLRNHSSKHKCDICGKGFRCAKDVEYHKRIIHFGESLFGCDQCGKNFSSNSGLVMHKKKIHQGKKDKCSICGKSVAQLSHHMKYHHSENKDEEIICELCGRSIKLKLLHSHMKTHDKNKMCTICDKFFIAGSKKLIEHLGQDHRVYCHDNDYYVCHTCHVKCRSSKELQDHLMKVHQLESNQHCENCVTSFPTKSLLAIHLMDCHNVKPSKAAQSLGTVSKVLTDHSTNAYTCDICDKKLASKRTLFDHKKQVHNRANHLKCDHCKYTSHEPSRLKRHILEKHTKATKFPCDQCSYVTNINSILLTHKRKVHEGSNKRDTCKECEKKFTNKKKLAEHMLADHNIVYEYTTPFGHNKL